MNNYDSWKLAEPDSALWGSFEEPELVSNCCGVKARSEADEQWGICSKCLENCDYIPLDERI